jgi:hypothetical protein
VLPIQALASIGIGRNRRDLVILELGTRRVGSSDLLLAKRSPAKTSRAPLDGRISEPSLTPNRRYRQAALRPESVRQHVRRSARTFAQNAQRAQAGLLSGSSERCRTGSKRRLPGQQRFPCAGLFYGRYRARTSDPQLVDSVQRSDRFAPVRVIRTVEPNALRRANGAEPERMTNVAIVATAIGARFVDSTPGRRLSLVNNSRRDELADRLVCRPVLCTRCRATCSSVPRSRATDRTRSAASGPSDVLASEREILSFIALAD